MKKEYTVGDAVDVLWKRLLHLVGTDSNFKESIEQWINIDCKELLIESFPGEESYFYHTAHQYFIWEFKNVKTYPPVRTMKWVYGEHACLYDVFICTECEGYLTTRDDMEEINEVTILCPRCNKIEKYPFQFLDRKHKTWDNFNEYAILSRKIMIKFNRRERIRDMFRNIWELRHWEYAKYRFKKLFGIRKKQTNGNV